MFEQQLRIAIWLIVSVAPWTAAVAIVYFLVSLPMRRYERARFFLDLLELGLKEGRAPEPAIVAISRSRDMSMGARFHLLAAYLETGLRLGQALAKVPRLLPPQINRMIEAGEEIGDIRKVIPACRQLVNDGLSQTRGAMNYLVILLLVLTPIAPAIFQLLSRVVFPRFLQILEDMEVPPPWFTVFVIDRVNLLGWVMCGAALAVYAAALIYVGGPRLAKWLQLRTLPISDWLVFQFPWRRKRMQRDFAGMLGSLLDANIPEPRAVKLAAASAANAVFARYAERALVDLQAGRKLVEALHQFDDTGEFRWRLTNAAYSPNGFRAALMGWIETLDASAFQQQQAAAHMITTGLVVLNGTLVGMLVVATFQAIIAIMNTAVLW